MAGEYVLDYSITSSSGSEGNDQGSIFSVVWLDINSTKPAIGCDIEKIRDDLYLIFEKKLKFFDDDFECEYYMRDQPLFTKILFLVDEVSAQTMAARASYISQIFCTFVYRKLDSSEQPCKEQNYSRMVKYIPIDQLVPCVKAFQARWLSYGSFTIISNLNNNADQSTIRINGLFLFLQHILDVLLELKPLASEFHLFIRECAETFSGEPAKLKQLQDFYMGYSSENPILWYTKNSFMHTLVNEAFRTENIEMLYLCRFFIRDICTQLGKHQCPDSIRVYRGQRMSKLEVANLPNLINQLVVVKSILSTSTSREIAKIFLSHSHDPQSENQLEPVLFEIDADPQLNGHDKKPFANIIDLSNFDAEKEVLFMFGSIFLLNGVCHEDGIWIVKMSLWKFEANELQPILDMLGNNQTNFEDNKSSVSFISLLIKFDRQDLSVKLTKRYLLELTWNGTTTRDNTIEIAKCYHLLGFIDLKQDQHDSAIAWFDKALKMFAIALPTKHLFTAATHISMGDALTRKGDMKQANVEYRAALHIYERDYGKEHPKTAACRDNIVWHASRKKKPFRRPIDFSQSFVEIKDIPLATFQSERFINIIGADQATALSSLPVEDMLKQFHLIIHSNTSDVTDENNSATRHLRLHPFANAIIPKRILFPFLLEIVSYQCPLCKEPVWVYKLFSMFKGAPCFRCIGKVLSFRRK